MEKSPTAIEPDLAGLDVLADPDVTTT